MALHASSHDEYARGPSNIVKGRCHCPFSRTVGAKPLNSAAGALGVNVNSYDAPFHAGGIACSIEGENEGRVTNRG